LPLLIGSRKNGGLIASVGVLCRSVPDQIQSCLCGLWRAAPAQAGIAVRNDFIDSQAGRERLSGLLRYIIETQRELVRLTTTVN
jgi:hypothetical protein